MQSVFAKINIDADEFERIYSGSAKDVVCRVSDGRRVRFPGHILKRFVTRQGIMGEFRIDFDDQMRFVKIEKIR